MIVFPSCVKEYSTAMAFDLVTRLAINPVDSRLRRVLVSIRWETLPRCLRNSPCRWGLSFSENKTLGVHLPIKIGEGVCGPCIVFIVLPSAKLRSEVICLTHSLPQFGTVSACQPVRAQRN